MSAPTLIPLLGLLVAFAAHAQERPSTPQDALRVQDARQRYAQRLAFVTALEHDLFEIDTVENSPVAAQPHIAGLLERPDLLQTTFRNRSAEIRNHLRNLLANEKKGLRRLWDSLEPEIADPEAIAIQRWQQRLSKKRAWVLTLEKELTDIRTITDSPEAAQPYIAEFIERPDLLERAFRSNVVTINSHLQELLAQARIELIILTDELGADNPPREEATETMPNTPSPQPPASPDAMRVMIQALDEQIQTLSEENRALRARVADLEIEVRGRP